MATSFTIDIDRDDLLEIRDFFQFIGVHTSDVLRVAINQTGGPVRTEASKQIRSQVNLKAGYLNERQGSGRRFEFVRATKNNIVGRIKTPNRSILLLRYATNPLLSSDVTWSKPPKEPPRGIRVKVKPNKGGAKAVSGGSEIDGKPFLMVLKNSKKLAVVGRRKELGKEGGKIKALYGPSLSQVFEDVAEDLTPFAADRYLKEQIDAMRYLLAKRSLPS